jgi:hypothetical protein
LFDKVDRVQIASVGDNNHRTVLQDMIEKAAELVEVAEALDLAISESHEAYLTSEDFGRRLGIEALFEPLLDAALQASSSLNHTISRIRQQMDKVEIDTDAIFRPARPQQGN